MSRKQFLFFPKIVAIVSVVLFYACTTEREVVLSVEGIRLSRAFVTLSPGDTLNLTATYPSTRNSGQFYIWASSNPDVATVANNGIVTAISLGTAIITAITDDGNYSANCTVTVSESIPMTVIMELSDVKNIVFSADGFGPLVVDWGDGTATETLLTYGTLTYLSHRYFEKSSYSVTVSGENITVLNCNDIPIRRLKISDNNTLTQLNCSGNRLTSLDVSGCSALTTLWCGDNHLTTLQVNGCSNLTTLWCANNQLRNLNVSGCKNLESLHCSNNILMDLNIEGCSSLVGIYCSNNYLRTLQVSDFPHLEGLYCSNNQLTSLVVKGAVSLKGLNCNNNRLTTLDLGRTAVRSLNCESNSLQAFALNALFATLPRSNGSIYFGDNPGTYLCSTTILREKGWDLYTERE